MECFFRENELTIFIRLVDLHTVTTPTYRHDRTIWTEPELRFYTIQPICSLKKFHYLAEEFGHSLAAKD